jgi:hypothetical protein
MSKIQKSVYQSKYVDWLSEMEWSYWCTFTTRYELTLKSARRLMERFHAINKRSDLNVRMFWVAEKFELKDGYHTHALLYVEQLHTDMISEKGCFEVLRYNYQRATGAKFSAIVDGKVTYTDYNRCQFSKFDKRKRRGAGGYCLKYVLKEQSNKFTEYDILC